MNAPLPIPPTWTTGSTAAIKTGTWRAALAKHVQAPSPCHAACPVHGDIAEWIGQARARDFHAAWQTLSRHNPFPAVIGRICHHPCESACNRAGYDEPLSICKLERCVGDMALERGWAHAAAATARAERVAVVGGGPSGLSAAYQLRRRGFAVTLFEAQPELGGLMRYGIPAYRLSRTVLDAEIARIVALGIDVRCGQAHGLARRPWPNCVPASTRSTWPTARGARSACRSSTTAGPGWWMAPTTWRAPAAARHRRSDTRVVVIGGGSAALDVARSARRAGHEVTILALEAEADMPAQREEVVEAREEGIALVDAALLRGVDESADRLAPRLRARALRGRCAARASSA